MGTINARDGTEIFYKDWGTCAARILDRQVDLSLLAVCLAL